LTMFNFFKKRFKKTSNKKTGFLFLGGGLNMENKEIERRNKAEWVEDCFINASSAELARTDKNYVGLSLSNKTMVRFFLFIFFVLFLLFSRSVYLQAVKGEYFLDIAEKNRIRLYNIPSPRGIIYDSQERPLVTNIPNFAVYISANDFFQQKEETQSKAVEWLKANFPHKDFTSEIQEIEDLTPRDKQYFEPHLLFDEIEYEKALKTKIQATAYSGVSVQVKARREYEDFFGGYKTESLAHVLGYEGVISPEQFAELSEKGYLFNDFIGKTGLENKYEEELRGDYGKERIEVDAQNRAVKILAKKEMVKGDGLYLSLDAVMQAKLENIIKKYLEKHGKSKAAAVVLNPNNGQVYSLISLPGFDNNLFARGINNKDYKRLSENPDKPLFNRTISGEYPSGSTFKPVVAAAALDDGLVTPNSSFVSRGGIRIFQWFFPDWKAGGHGITNVYKAIAESVNTYFYIIGGGYADFDGLGVKKIKDYAEKFGLNKVCGIDLPNEQSGFLPSPEWKQQVKNERWYIGDTYHLAIGQGDILVTPLQVANYTSVFANKGTLYQPRILDKVFDQKKDDFVEPKNKILNKDFVSPESIKAVRQGMRQAVTYGSARILGGLPVSSAAKTGTAQWGQDKEPHSWFTAFAPYDQPEITVTVVVEEGGEGTEAAAPIVYEFMKWYFGYYQKTLSSE